MKHNKFKTNTLTTAASQDQSQKPQQERVRVLQPARFGYTGANGNEAHQIQNKQVDNSSLDQTKPKTQDFKKGFHVGGSDGVDHVAREVLQHGVANRGSRGSGWWCNKAFEYPLDRQGDKPRHCYRKVRKCCQSPRHLGEILLLIILVVHVDMFE